MEAKTDNAGYLVETKSGMQGRTYHKQGLINGKFPVYIYGEETPILCERDSLKFIGFID